MSRPILPRRKKYQDWYLQLTARKPGPRLLSIDMLDQLDACQSNEARRLLLGVSEKEIA